MAIYLITVVLAVGMTYVAQRVNDSATDQLRGQAFLSQTIGKRWLFWGLGILSMLIPALVSGLRYGVGTDYFYTYRPMWDEVIWWRTQNNPAYPAEPGMWELINLLERLGGSYLSMFITTSFIIMGFFGLGFYQNSEMPWYSVALFFLTEAYFVSMNAVQQYMALAVVFFGLRFVKKPCFWKYAICVLAATLFHYSAIILLPLYFFSKISVNPAFGLGITAVLSLLNGQLLQLLGYIIQRTPYAWYLGSNFQQMNRFYPGKMTINILVLALATYYYYTNNNHAKPLYRFLYYCQLLQVFMLINRNLIPLADRVGWYLEGFLLLLLPMIVISEKNKYLRIALIVIPAFLWGRLCYNEIFLYGWHEVVPYQSIFAHQ